MHSPLRVEKRQASLFDEDTAGIRHFHNASFIADEEVESMLVFEVGNQFAEGRLGYAQSLRRPCEVQIFGQGNDCVQVAYFNVGKHCSEPRTRIW
jgi:hypothetical protein